MRSFIKSHTRAGSSGNDKESKEPSRPSSGNYSNDSDSIKNKSSFELISTNINQFTSPFTSPTFAAPMSPIPYSFSPRKNSNSDAVENSSSSFPSSPIKSSHKSTKQYAMPVEEAQTPKLKILKYPKSLFSKSNNLKDNFKELDFGNSSPSIRGSVKHNWDDGHQNALRINTNFDDFSKNSLPEKSPYSAKQEVKPRYAHAAQSSIDSIRNSSLQRLLGDESYTQSENSADDASPLIPDVLFVADVSSPTIEAGMKQRPSPVIAAAPKILKASTTPTESSPLGSESTSRSKRVSVLQVNIDRRASILNKLKKKGESSLKEEPQMRDDSSDSAFSFEDDINGRNLSMKYYKKSPDKPKVVEEPAMMYIDDYDAYGEEDFDEEMNYYDEEEDDTEDLFNRSMFWDDSGIPSGAEAGIIKEDMIVSEDVVNNKSAFIKEKEEIRKEDISKETEKEEMRREQIREEEIKKEAIKKEKIENEQVKEEHIKEIETLKQITNEKETLKSIAKENTNLHQRDSWKNQGIDYEDTSNEYIDDDYLDEVNVVPEDFEFDPDVEYQYDAHKKEIIYNPKNRMHRSNSYSKKPKPGQFSVGEQSNVFGKTDGKTVTLFNSKSDNEEAEVTPPSSTLNDLLSPITEGYSDREYIE